MAAALSLAQSLAGTTEPPRREAGTADVALPTAPRSAVVQQGCVPMPSVAEASRATHESSDPSSSAVLLPEPIGTDGARGQAFGQTSAGVVLAKTSAAEQGPQDRPNLTPLAGRPARRNRRGSDLHGFDEGSAPVKEGAGKRHERETSRRKYSHLQQLANLAQECELSPSADELRPAERINKARNDDFLSC